MKNEQFEQLITQYEPMIYSIMRSINVYQEQQDYYQLGLISLWKAHERHDYTKGAFAPFAYATIRGYMLAHLRKKVELADRQPTIHYEMVSAPSYEHTYLEQEYLSPYLEGLSARELTYVMDHVVHGYSFRTMAHTYGVSEETVKAWGKTARKKLRAKKHLFKP
ncbi:sigma-70 family RNA polymerase sigma factor [Priestia koreensis]|uniref:sigma-70 family RNA polymerase sigma factor n=1 Tax=Priestia koreensis TaxID=284581 RepID=UPI001F560095|nr:sigma-70 family RNA polymerase sigma factor [Priestia koreensis]UNL85810.1 sigma-70 family RNA polymerase sigma factor [Priestia koreensis]